MAADPNRSDISQFMIIGLGTMMSADWWHDVTTTAAGTTSTAAKAYTAYNLKMTSDNASNGISAALESTFNWNPGYEVGASFNPVTTVGMAKQSRTIAWQANWRDSDTRTAVNNNCSDDGFSWPHRTLGWKMLKDDLFGIDIGGDNSGHPKLVSVGETRSYAGSGTAAHDVDSVCLDCHNPTIWNASSTMNHTDSASSSTDDYNDDVLLRGLP